MGLHLSDISFAKRKIARILLDFQRKHPKCTAHFYCTHQNDVKWDSRGFRKKNCLHYFLCTLFLPFFTLLLLLLFQYIIKLFYGSSQQSSIVAEQTTTKPTPTANVFEFKEFENTNVCTCEWVCSFFSYARINDVCTLSSFSTKWNVCTSEMSCRASDRNILRWSNRVCVTIHSRESHGGVCGKQQ